MPRTANDLYNEALQLPEDERVHLADLLESSVDTSSIEQSWLNLAKQRLDDIDAGRTELVPSDVVFARLRNRKASY
jgi:putative addiction module component (TIGR02574 family)